MSFVSALPFADTMAYWWRELAGDPSRLRFMTLKALEVTAFFGNYVSGMRAPASPSSAGLPSTATRAPNAMPAEPRVVVIVPTFCRSARDLHLLEALLDSLGRQTHPCHALLIDDGSPRPVPHGKAEIIRLEKNSGPAAARNRGLDRAATLEADAVAFLDADCIPADDWVASFVGEFQADPRAHALSGATWSGDQSRLGRYHERNGTLNGRRLRGGARLLYGPTCNLALCAQLARSLRFDESFPIAAAEDIDFCYRANQLGWSIMHAANAIVWHDYGYDGLGPIRKVARMWGQFRRYARGERLLLRKHPSYHRDFEGSSEISLRG